jgi:phage shock protein PspC (stress-responsive transcriptional regulator)
MMDSSQPALPMRDHTVLGVCEGLGEDFGFNPLWLRILFAAPLIWHPLYVVGAYLALGLVVLVSRLLVPSRRAAAPAVDDSAAAPAEARAGEMAIAA